VRQASRNVHPGILAQPKLFGFELRPDQKYFRLCSRRGEGGGNPALCCYSPPCAVIPLTLLTFANRNQQPRDYESHLLEARLLVLLQLDRRTHSTTAYAPVIDTLLIGVVVIVLRLLGRVARECNGGKGISRVSWDRFFAAGGDIVPQRTRKRKKRCRKQRSNTVRQHVAAGYVRNRTAKGFFLLELLSPLYSRRRWCGTAAAQRATLTSMCQNESVRLGCLPLLCCHRITPGARELVRCTLGRNPRPPAIYEELIYERISVPAGMQRGGCCKTTTRLCPPTSGQFSRVFSDVRRRFNGESAYCAKALSCKYIA